MDDGGRGGDPLPPGWSCARDPSSGRPFYYHAGAQQSQWEPPHEAGLARCAGELVFQTQHAAWQNRYAIFSVPPVPGTLWLFPGCALNQGRQTENRSSTQGRMLACGQVHDACSLTTHDRDARVTSMADSEGSACIWCATGRGRAERWQWVRVTAHLGRVQSLDNGARSRPAVSVADVSHVLRLAAQHELAPSK